MLLGPDRTIDGAFIKHRQDDGKPTATRAQRRAPGIWSGIAVRWKWAERARSFDNDERGKVREEHFKQVVATQRKHRILLDAAFTKYIAAFQRVEVAKLSLSHAVTILGQLINLDRLGMGLPLTIEQIQGRFGIADSEPTETEQAQMAGNADVPSAMFTNEQYAEILQIMATHGAFYDGDDQEARPAHRGPDDDRPPRPANLRQNAPECDRTGLTQPGRCQID